MSYPTYPAGSDQLGAHPFPNQRPYSHWIKRVGAALIDGLTVVPFWVLGVIVAVAAHQSHTVTMGYTANGTAASTQVSDGLSATGFTLLGIVYLAMIVFFLWNVVFRQGRTGYSLGKSALGIKLVKDGSGEVAGAGRTFLRQIAHILDSVFYLGYLWPLWDSKRQTFADKICTTVVLDRPKG
jgi:uncharacterized RDD family membrane protein YckC